MNESGTAGDQAQAQAHALLAAVARTNIQLYGQLQAQQRPAHELALVKRAYDLASRLYAAAYQADGKPFVVHVVSVASVMALLQASTASVATGLLHNVYNNADFGDGRHSHVDSRRRQMVLDAVGVDVERRISRFAELRVERRLDDLLTRAPWLDDIDRELVVMDLADVLEKHLDGGVLYFGDAQWVTRFATSRLPDLQELARALEQPVLAQALGIAVQSVAAMHVDPVLRSAPERRYLHFQPPPSTRTALVPAWRGSRMRRWLSRRLRFGARGRSRPARLT